MGCASSAYVFGRNKKTKKTIPEVTIFIPSIRVPVYSDLFSATTLNNGFIHKDLARTITSLRNQIVLVAEDTEASAITQLQQALQQYLPLLLGLATKEYGLDEVGEFKWKNLEDGKEEMMCEANLWFELLSVLHMMAMLTLVEANSKLIPKNTTDSCGRQLVTTDCMRDAVDLLVKAAGYLDLCVRDISLRLHPDIKERLPVDLQEQVLAAILNQALAQGTEIQFSLALETQNATLSVKRRLACEQLSYFGQAHCCLSEANDSKGATQKHLMFIKWKYLEAKAAAYYYHGLIVEKGTEASSSHVSALCCFLAAEELLAESKRACLSFCLANPVTRAPPPWGAMKHLNKKIPETALKKSQMYGYLLDQQEKTVQLLMPDLPEFQLSLKPDDYVLPEVDSAWDSNNSDIPIPIPIPAQTLKDHLEDCDEDVAQQSGL
nr:BRO1 domain-containing protein BROX homolog isoform X2 [Ipomoea batatas]